MYKIRANQLSCFHIQKSRVVSKPFRRTHKCIQCYYFIAAKCLQHFHKIRPKASIEVYSLSYICLVCWRRRQRVREKRNDGCYRLRALFFHGGDGEEKFHEPVINVFGLKGLDNEDLVPSDWVEYLKVDLTVIELAANMPPKAYIQVTSYLSGQHLCVKREYLEVRELGLQGCEEDLIDCRLNLRCRILLLAGLRSHPPSGRQGSNKTS